MKRTPPPPIIRILVCCVLVWAVRSAYASPTTAPARVPIADVPQFEDLYERALRDLRGFDAPLVDEVYFISMGIDQAGEYIDPPPEFLARFHDLTVRVLPISQAKWIRWGTREPRSWRLDHAETGESGRIYYIVVNAYRMEGEISIDVGFTNGPVGGGGRRVVYKRVAGAWIFDRIVFQWVS